MGKSITIYDQKKQKVCINTSKIIAKVQAKSKLDTEQTSLSVTFFIGKQLKATNRQGNSTRSQILCYDLVLSKHHHYPNALPPFLKKLQRAKKNTYS